MKPKTHIAPFSAGFLKGDQPPPCLAAPPGLFKNPRPGDWVEFENPDGPHPVRKIMRVAADSDGGYCLAFEPMLTGLNRLLTLEIPVEEDRAALRTGLRTYVYVPGSTRAAVGDTVRFTKPGEDPGITPHCRVMHISTLGHVQVLSLEELF